MRITIELSEAQHARLLELAERRSQEGISVVVQEAIDLYLETRSIEPKAVLKALRTCGSLTAQEARELRSRVAGGRDVWR